MFPQRSSQVPQKKRTLEALHFFACGANFSLSFLVQMFLKKEEVRYLRKN